MAKIKKWSYIIDDVEYHPQLHYYCLGCKTIHAISLKIHSFNGDFDRPTFSPSLLQNFTPNQICHSYITNGNIQYLSDCFHELKGQTIELPDIEQYTKDY